MGWKSDSSTAHREASQFQTDPKAQRRWDFQNEQELFVKYLKK